MSLSVSIDGVEMVSARLDAIQGAVQNAGAGLLESAMSTVYPAVLEAAATVWGVRTGSYLAGWGMEQVDGMTIRISNEVLSEDGFLYPASLEYGWATRNGGFVESPGVLIPSVVENIDALAGEFALWLSQQGS